MGYEKKVYVSFPDPTKVYGNFDLDIQCQNYKYDTIESGKLNWFFLYEKVEIDWGTSISYPKLGIFSDFKIKPKSLTFISTKKKEDDKFTIDNNYISHNTLLVYGNWEKMPSWRDLKRAYEKTWWFRKTNQQKRQNKIQLILE